MVLMFVRDRARERRPQHLPDLLQTSATAREGMFFRATMRQQEDGVCQ
jgi:hypothetical protein